MTYMGIVANRFSVGATAAGTPGGETPTGTGVNRALNSKLQGTGEPTNWTNPFPGEGAIALSAGTLPDHQKMQLTSTADSGDKSVREQIYDVVQGDVITISATVKAFSGSSTDPNDPHVILNHAPFSYATVAGGPGARPNLESIAVDTIAYYTLTVNVTGQLKIRFGLDRTGSVTLENIMVDFFNGLRNYVATDPIDEPSPGALDIKTIPYNGQYIGLPMGVSGNNSNQVRDGRRGGRYRVRHTGTITEFHFQIATNQNDGESSKSRLGGAAPHPYPASWNYRLEIFDATEAWSVSGAARFSQDFTVYTKDGSAAYSRVIYVFDQTNHGLSLAVNDGDRLVWRLTNLSGSKNANYVSINSVSVFGNDGIYWCGVGRTPPQAAGYWHGDDNIAVSFDGGGNNTSPLARGPQNVAAVRYADGVVDGDIAMDATMTVMAVYIGGTNIARQTWTQGDYYARASGLLAFAWHRSATPPSAALRATVSGSDIATQNIDFAPGIIPARNSTLLGVQQNWPSPVTFSPGQTYELRISSASSPFATGYMFGCRRIAGVLSSGIGLYNGTLYSPPPQSPAPAAYNLINRHQWSGSAQKSSNNGSSWDVVGWPSGAADLPFAFVLNGNVSNTLGGLM